jgi:hypothetical protein
VLPTDRDAVAAALQMCGQPDPAAVRLVRIRSTLSPYDLYASTALREQIDADASLEVLGPARPMAFAGDGSLASWE